MFECVPWFMTLRLEVLHIRIAGGAVFKTWPRLFGEQLQVTAFHLIFVLWVQHRSVEYVIYHLSCTVPLHMPQVPLSSIGCDFFFGEEQAETPLGVIPESDERRAHRSCTQILLSTKSRLLWKPWGMSMYWSMLSSTALVCIVDPTSIVDLICVCWNVTYAEELLP